MCRELAELAMGLARNAAQAAGFEWPANPLAPQPPQAEPAPTPHQAATPHTHPDHTPRPETASPNLAFTRLMRGIKQIMALEAAITATQQASIEKAARQASNHAFIESFKTKPAAPQPTPEPSRPEPSPARAHTADPPSLLASISRDLGIDLEDPTLADRLPTFFRPAPQTQPTGPPD